MSRPDVSNRKAPLYPILALGAVLALFAAPFFLWPLYSVWAAQMAGRAKLAEAQHAKQVLVEQARAEVEAAKLRAEAIQLVGRAAKEFPEYREQEFIGAFAEAMQHGSIQKIVYVPTEANIPIIEARARD